MCCLYLIFIGLCIIKIYKIRDNYFVFIIEFFFFMILMILLNNIIFYYLILIFLDEGCYNVVKNNKNMLLIEML